jgi:cytochrome d ubiquinol oxidase subunit I
MERLVHVLLGAFILGAFFVMSVSAYYLLKKRHREFARRSFIIALVLGAAASLAEGISGDSQARRLATTQPAKLAAFEGLYRTEPGGTRLTLAGFPDTAEERLDGAIAIPKLLSLLVYGDPNRPVSGLDQVPRGDWPPVTIPFHAYHGMVGLGFLLLGLTLLALFLLWRRRLFEQRWLLWVFVFAVVGPFAANQLGWVSAEVGRQPWVVYGLLRTSDGLSRAVAADAILGSIAMFGIIYLLLFAVWVYVLNDKIQHGPEEAHEVPGATTAQGLLETAGRLKAHRGFSMTEADGSEPDPKEK